MSGITNECIEKELQSLLEKGSLNPSNIRWFNDLCKAMWNLSKMRHAFTEEDAKEWADYVTKANGGIPPTDERFEQIAKELGVSQVQVSRIENKIINLFKSQI